MAVPQTRHTNLFLKAVQADASPLFGLFAAIGPTYEEGLLSLESCFLIHRVPANSQPKIKPIVSKLTHQSFSLIAL